MSNNNSPVQSLTVTVPPKNSQSNKISSVVKVDGGVDPNFSLHSKTTVSVDEKSKPTSCKDVDPDCCDPSFAVKEKFRAFDTTCINIEPKSILPYVAPSASMYNPMPYMFRIPGVGIHGSFLQQPIRCPPYYVQLDHAISVVWTLYSNQPTNRSLGINQLQWALVFLDNIKNEQGRATKDIAHCINTISDELIEQYAELASDTQFKKNRKSANKSGNRPTPLAESSTIDASEETPKTSCVDVNATVGDRTFTIQKNVPFSITYADMIIRTPPTINIINSTTMKSETNADIDKIKMMDYLGEWKKDQMKKIYLELERLHSIEEYMGCSNANDDSKIQSFLNERSKETKK